MLLVWVNGSCHSARSRFHVDSWSDSRQLSRAYAARKAAVHTPSAERPGPLSDRLREAFSAAGLSFLGGGEAAPTKPSKVAPGHAFEVYPHAAIIELMQLPSRLPYKVGRRSTLFKHLDTEAAAAGARSTSTRCTATSHCASRASTSCCPARRRC